MNLAKLVGNNNHNTVAKNTLLLYVALPEIGEQQPGSSSPILQ